VIGVVVVTHGQLATELVNAAEMIVGDLPQFSAVSIGWHDDVNDARDDITQAIERVRGDGGVLLLTDMFGGTPSNLAMTFLETDRLEVITGVNLPMLIKLAGLRSSSNLLAVAREMRDDGRHAIWVASDLMRGEREAGGAQQEPPEGERVGARRGSIGDGERTGRSPTTPDGSEPRTGG
jgi:mannose PTS system EIIA component